MLLSVFSVCWGVLERLFARRSRQSM